MGLRTKIDIAVSVGFDNSLDDGPFDRDLSEMLDTMDHALPFVLTLAPSATDIEVVFSAEVTQGYFLYLEADGEIDFKLDATDALRIRHLSRMCDPSSSNAPNLKARCATTEKFTRLFLTNPSSLVARQVRGVVVGDLTTT